MAVPWSRSSVTSVVTEEGNAKDFEFVTDIHAEAGKTEIVLFN